MFFEKDKFYKNKFFNSLLIIACLILIFVGKLDLIAFRNLSSFLTDFLSPISSFVSKPALELECYKRYSICNFSEEWKY